MWRLFYTVRNVIGRERKRERGKEGARVHILYHYNIGKD